MIDVTEQHQARMALEKAFDEIKKSQDRLRLVIDTIPGMVLSALPEDTHRFLAKLEEATPLRYALAPVCGTCCVAPHFGHRISSSSNRAVPGWHLSPQYGSAVPDRGSWPRCSPRLYCLF